MKRVIEGCQHTRERMIEWIDEGACPICLTAGAGMNKERAEVAEGQLCRARDRDGMAAHIYKIAVDEMRIRGGRHMWRILELFEENKRLRETLDWACAIPTRLDDVRMTIPHMFTNELRRRMEGKK